jgi:DNA-binding MarR family transcriptional regulator
VSEASANKQAKRTKKKSKPGRKRMGKEVFVPVTMKVEPSELATIEAIAKASSRSRSDVMREMVTLGMERMLESAFAPQGEKGPEPAVAASAPEAGSPEDIAGAITDARAQRQEVEALMPAASEGTATRAQWAELAWRSAAVLCDAAGIEAGDPPVGPVQALSVIALEKTSADESGPLQSVLGFSNDEAASLGRAASLVLRSGLLAGETPSVDSGAAVRDAVMTIADAAIGGDVAVSDAQGGASVPDLPEDPKLARVLSQKGAREIVAYVSRHPRANTSELLAATGVSSSTLRRRIASLQEAGELSNGGTATRPVWRVPGVHHEPEDMLTATQAAVLGLMRRKPPTPTGQISDELGITKTAVTIAYRELAEMGLAFKDGGRWRATPQPQDEGVADV